MRTWILWKERGRGSRRWEGVAPLLHEGLLIRHGASYLKVCSVLVDVSFSHDILQIVRCVPYRGPLRGIGDM